MLCSCSEAWREGKGPAGVVVGASVRLWLWVGTGLQETQRTSHFTALSQHSPTLCRCGHTHAPSSGSCQGLALGLGSPRIEPRLQDWKLGACPPPPGVWPSPVPPGLRMARDWPQPREKL